MAIWRRSAKIIVMGKRVRLLLALSAIIPSLALAQTGSNFITSSMAMPTSSIASNEGVIFSESDVLDKPFIRVHKILSPELEKKVNSYFIRPGDIFAKDFSRSTNVIANVGIEGEKLVFYMDLIAGETQTYLPNKPEKPLIDVSLVKLADFDFINGRLIINNDQVIDWSNITEKLKAEHGTFVGIATISNSYLKSAMYNFFIYPNYKGGVLKFDIEGVKGEVDVRENLTNNNGFLELSNAQGNHLVKIQPNEIYAQVKDFVTKNSDTELLGIDLVINKSEAAYRIKVKEPFVWFWIFEGKIKSEYYIGAGEDNIITIDENRPWYSIFGAVHGFRPQEIASKMIASQQSQATSTPEENK